MNVVAKVVTMRLPGVSQSSGFNLRGGLNKRVGWVFRMCGCNFRGGVNNAWTACAALVTTLARRSAFAMLVIHKSSKGKAACEF